MAFEFINNELAERNRHGLLRRLRPVSWQGVNLVNLNGSRLVNFASNDYLGLAQSEQLHQAWQHNAALFPGSSSSSALVSGHSEAHQQLSDALANWLGREAVLLFNSGFAANMALCQALGQANTGFYADKLVHASVIEGMQASRAKMKRFAHNDLQHLEQIMLANDAKDRLILTESVFSMDGDISPALELAKLASKHDSWLCLDDAHGFGTLGAQGMGIVEHAGLDQQQLPIVMGTFGKAVGTAGSFVAGSQALIDYLTNYARHFIYSTQFSPLQAATTLVALNFVRAQAWRREKLAENIDFFREKAQQAGLNLLASHSAIQPVVVGDPQRCIAVANALQERGYLVVGMRYPTVPKGTDRLRVTLNCEHNVKQIKELVNSVVQCLEEVKHA